MTSSSSPKTPEWMQKKERGSMFWLRVMSRISLLLGRRLSRGIVYGIAFYFTLTSPAARQASKKYLARCLGRPATWLDIYRHILTFSTTIHDRFYLLNDQYHSFDIRVYGTEPVRALLKCRKGMFLFGGHLGSFEILRSHARDNPDLNVYMAMFPETARQLDSALAAINPQAVQKIISLGQIDAMLNIHQRLEEGAIVGMLADRASGPDQYIRLPFLGEEASFPTGPFRIAAVLRHPVYFMVGLHRGGNRYDIHFELLEDFSQPSNTKRNVLVQEALAKYVARLEHHCQSAPYNWFNFFDFWKPHDQA